MKQSWLYLSRLCLEYPSMSSIIYVLLNNYANSATIKELILLITSQTMRHKSRSQRCLSFLVIYIWHGFFLIKQPNKHYFAYILNTYYLSVLLLICNCNKWEKRIFLYTSFFFAVFNSDLRLRSLFCRTYIQASHKASTLSTNICVVILSYAGFEPVNVEQILLFMQSKNANRNRQKYISPLFTSQCNSNVQNSPVRSKLFQFTAFLPSKSNEIFFVYIFIIIIMWNRPRRILSL